MNWSEVEPVLRAVYELLDEDPEEDRVACQAVLDRLSRPANDARTIRDLARLYDAGYIDGFMADQSPAPIFISATEKGLQQIESWPRGGGADQVGLLLRLLDERITDPELAEDERTRLQQLRDAAGDVGQGVLQTVLGAWLMHVTGATGG